MPISHHVHSLGLAFALPTILVAALLGGCSGVAGPKSGASPAEPVVVLGPTTRADLLAAVPPWADALRSAVPDPDASFALAAVPPGATVEVYLGSWCGDSKRELARFWKALDLAGRPMPFHLELIGVGRDKQHPAELLAGVDLRYVPTFVVKRDGVEVGRIVESAPDGIERSLHALLSGLTTGLITGRDDLGPKAPSLLAVD